MNSKAFEFLLQLERLQRSTTFLRLTIKESVRGPMVMDSNYKIVNLLIKKYATLIREDYGVLFDNKTELELLYELLFRKLGKEQATMISRQLFNITPCKKGLEATILFTTGDVVSGYINKLLIEGRRTYVAISAFDGSSVLRRFQIGEVVSVDSLSAPSTEEQREIQRTLTRYMTP